MKLEKNILYCQVFILGWEGAGGYGLVQPLVSSFWFFINVFFTFNFVGLEVDRPFEK